MSHGRLHGKSGAVPAAIPAAMENRIEKTDRKGELVDIARKAMATDPDDRHRGQAASL
jgi:hypothetical protein